MKTIKDNSDFAERVRNLMAYLDENGLYITYDGGGFKISDMKNDNPLFNNCTLCDAENLYEDIQEMPCQCNFKLRVFE